MEVANATAMHSKLRKFDLMSSVGFLKVGSMKGVERMSNKIHKVG